METQERNLSQALKISRAISHPFPLDLIVLNPQEVQARLEGGDLVLREILYAIAFRYPGVTAGKEEARAAIKAMERVRKLTRDYRAKRQESR